jgi:chromosome segregation ATPase
MSRFLSHYLQGAKTGIATISLIGSGLVLGWGVIASKTIYIIGGSFGLLAPAFLLLDSSVITKKLRETFKKIKEQTEILQLSLNDFRVQNRRLERTNCRLEVDLDQLENIKGKLVKQCENLTESVEKSQLQIMSLETIREDFSRSNQILEKESQEFQTENQKLQLSVSLVNQELTKLEQLKEQYLTENQRLQETVGDNQAQLADLQGQVEKLKDLYDNAKKLLVNLATAGDMFTEFSSSLGDLNQTQSDLNQTQSGLDQTLNSMKNLLTRLKETTFEKLDSNQDGQISTLEFDNNLSEI